MKLEETLEFCVCNNLEESSLSRPEISKSYWILTFDLHAGLLVYKFYDKISKHSSPYVWTTQLSKREFLADKHNDSQTGKATWSCKMDKITADGKEQC